MTGGWDTRTLDNMNPNETLIRDTGGHDARADFGPVSVITGERATLLLAATSADIEEDWDSAVAWAWAQGFTFADDNASVKTANGAEVFSLVRIAD